EGFFFEQTHCGIDICDHRWLEEIRPEIGASPAAALDLGAPLSRVVEQITHPLDMLWPNERADVGCGIATWTEAQFFCFLHANRDEFLRDSLFHEEPLNREANLPAVRVAAPNSAAGGGIEIGVG